MAVSRESLYAEVWKEPMTKVAARYGVSSSFLARICARIKVPRPARGYWAQLEVGAALPQPPLAEAQPGDELEWSRDGAPRRAPHPLPQAPNSFGTVVKANRTSSLGLLAEVREQFESAEESDSGYLNPSKRQLLDIVVSRSSLDRAIAAAKAIFFALEERGHRVLLAPFPHLGRPALDERSESVGRHYHSQQWSPARPTLVYVGTVAIGLTLYEMSESVEMRYVDGKYVRVTDLARSTRRSAMSTDWTHRRDASSGQLCLRASSPYLRAKWERQWLESKTARLTTQVAELVHVLESEAATIAALVAEGERQAEIDQQEREAQHRVWKREQAERERLRNIEESRDELSSIIENWNVAKKIEAFFEDAERRTAGLSEADRDDARKRIQQARVLFGGVDALQRLRSWEPPNER